MSEIFKAYDIRGIYGETLTDDLAYRIGRAYATFIDCKRVVVGMDMRPHSAPLFENLARGLTEQGVDVINLGLCSTPMSYFANGRLEADGGIMITASHNPGEWNGFKLCRAKAVPISGVTGIMDIKRIAESGDFAPAAETPGNISEYNIVDQYAEFIRSRSPLKKSMKVVVDYANAMGIIEGKVFDGLLEVDPLFDRLDGTFPNHEANPLDLDTLVPLQARMRETDAVLGIAFDGDADRAGFVDELGNVVPMDIITTLIAQSILKTRKGIVYYDLRSSWAVKEVIAESGGTPKMSRVGHAFIKAQMAEDDAIFAGELSGHYYFQDNYYAESSSLAALYIAAIIESSGLPLSELVKPIQRYFASGEINSTVEDAAAVLDTVRERYADGNLFELDGVSVEFEDWWFNVRMSNTEPLVRLNLEAKKPELMEEKRDELLAIIRG